MSPTLSWRSFSCRIGAVLGFLSGLSMPPNSCMRAAKKKARKTKRQVNEKRQARASFSTVVGHWDVGVAVWTAIGTASKEWGTSALPHHDVHMRRHCVHTLSALAGLGRGLDGLGGRPRRGPRIGGRPMCTLLRRSVFP
ncbi:hypothetical protein TW95_gp1293 [Pandoravirus inopinatum]|uniref:Uncharacterized protein n=1 Tax=Pandoravirus inopinatum TaxID=1605721 RepID=A0A0B5JE36_9VIRU|nr:hypothetical protein TW95_gp1293 [Pandoravirus inopinatum]AJF98027.1 hypothetical protein [Pandoravirus inopinatum]